jgi:ubiquinone/menaquinone biosynthesis C-methylase UbiE
MKKKSARKPQVEITGLEARYYDMLMNLISFGSYESFIQRVINDLPLKPDDIVMDLGAGTGKNAEIILEKMNEKGRIFAVEIGEEMRHQLTEKQKNDSRIIILNQRIEESFMLPEPATLSFISFVIHGFTQPSRLKVVQNVYNNLAQNGHFCILDYNHFEVNETPWYIQFAIRRVECETAEDFIMRDWRFILEQYGFKEFITRVYIKGYVRLLCCKKASPSYT